MTPSRSNAIILALAIVGFVVLVPGLARTTEAQQRGQVYSTQSKPQTTLKGGVQQNVGKGVNNLGVNNTSSDYYVGQLLVDMYHQLSIMWGNASASQDAQRAFQYDVTQFRGYVSAGSTVAAKLAPCVSQYQQAYPHVVLQSQYYSQNNSSAFNSEGAIAKPLINSGASCVNTATANQFASNNGKIYNTYQSTPPPPLGPAPVYQAPSGAWTPRCQTPTSTNCYIWLLNRNGLYDHIYQGGPPNCSKGPPGGYDPSQNPACEALAAPQPQAPYGQPQPGAYPPLQQASDFSNEMRRAAETMLQAAGRIAKASSAAMDVTKHNNVGVGVAVGGYFGILASTIGNVAREYQAVAAANRAASQQNAILPIAEEAASESQAMADQATETVAELAAGKPAAAALAGSASSVGFLDDVEPLAAASTPIVSQGALPTCTVLSCYRLAELLGRNVSIFDVFNRIRPIVVATIVKNGNLVSVSMDRGLTLQEISSALPSIGIRAEVATGVTNMMNEVRAGRPLIAFVSTINPGAAAAGVKLPIHAVVVEGMEYRAGVLGLKIYDPIGMFYWKPLSTFEQFFTGGFVKPI